MPRSIESATDKESPSRWWQNLLDTAALRIVVLVGLFTGAALYQAAHLSALTDPDIWWHLRTGTWILQNHAVPHDGLFSQSASLNWVDSSWGFDLLVAVAVKAVDLRGLPILRMVLQVAIAAALFLLARGTRKNLWPAAILAAVAQYCISGLEPRRALVSVLFFAVSLAMLLHSRRTGQIRPVLWLPLLFLIWANLDRQFAYGLLALVLFCAVAIVEHLGRRSGSAWFESHRPNLSLSVSAAISGVCVLATLASPYTYHLHELIWQGATSTAVDYYLPDLHGMRFRQPQDYLLMLLVMAAFLTLGWRRSRDLFHISLLAVCSAVSFRLQRDSWLVALVAIGIIANAIFVDERDEPQEPVRPAWRREKLLTAALILVALAVSALQLPAQYEVLMTRVGQTFPVRASDYIRQNRLPQPLFNTYAWGGFLTWYLPEYPVVIDGRVDLYRDANNLPYFKLTQAEIPLESHPGFAQAQTFLLEAKSPIAEALATLPGFRVAYRDDLACVLVRRN
ncbi:MAG: hypothetical protein WCC22_01260 [Terriglobales bacterium]